MQYFRHILFILCWLPSLCLSETILYACTINGHTTLTDNITSNCDTVKEYRYNSFDKPHTENAPLTALRTQELNTLNVLEGNLSGPNLKRYEHVDENVGSALSSSYVDSVQDKCAFYQALFNSAASYVAVKDDQGVEIGPYRSAELLTQLDHAQKQIDYYCGN